MVPIWAWIIFFFIKSWLETHPTLEKIKMLNLDQELIMTRIILQTRGKWKFKYQELRKTVKKKQKSSRNSNAKGMPKRKTKKPSQG